MFSPCCFTDRKKELVFNGKGPSQNTVLPFSACIDLPMASRKDSGSAAPPTTVMASTSGTLDSPVKQIQIEGLVSDTLMNLGGGCERKRLPSVNRCGC